MWHCYSKLVSKGFLFVCFFTRKLITLGLHWQNSDNKLIHFSLNRSLLIIPQMSKCGQNRGLVHRDEFVYLHKTTKRKSWKKWL